MCILSVKVNENPTFVDSNMDDDIVFNDYSEDEENADDDIDNVSILIISLNAYPLKCSSLQIFRVTKSAMK